MNKFFSIIMVSSCLISLTACDKLKSFPKPKTTETINKINASFENIKNANTHMTTYGKNSPIVGFTSGVNGSYITHGDNSPIVIGAKSSVFTNDK